MQLKPLCALSLLLVSTLTHAASFEQEKATIDTFFKQYRTLATQGMDKFTKERNQLFSQNSLTIVNDDTRSEYKGKVGHIQSIKDWFATYATTNDFSYHIVGEVRENVVEVELYGTLHKVINDKKIVIVPSRHKWHEYFTFNDKGEITQLQIDMNILSDTYNAKARNEFSQNDVAAFVYDWFAAFDHQRESGYFLARIATPVDMYYPDFPIRSYQDFLRWYKGVTDNIIVNSHDLTNLRIKGTHQTGWNVSYDVLWQASAKNGDKYKMTVQQKLKIIVQDGQMKLAKLHAEVAK